MPNLFGWRMNYLSWWLMNNLFRWLITSGSSGGVPLAIGLGLSLANTAHTKQSRPCSGLGFQVKVLKLLPFLDAPITCLGGA